MRITRLDDAAHHSGRGRHAVWVPAAPRPHPHPPPPPPRSLPVFRHWLTRGWESEPSETWVAVDEATGETLGWYRIELPDLENKHRSVGSPTVGPAARAGSAQDPAGPGRLAARDGGGGGGRLLAGVVDGTDPGGTPRPSRRG